jgi:hypothetical protein
MIATGTQKIRYEWSITFSDGSVMPLDQAQKLYKDGLISVDGSSKSMRAHLVRLLVGKDVIIGRLGRWVTGMSHKEMSNL